MIVEIVGSDCINGTKLYNNVNMIAEEISPYIQVIKANAEYSKRKYNIKKRPGFVVGGKLISEGKVLKNDEIREILSNIKIK